LDVKISGTEVVHFEFEINAPLREIADNDVVVRFTMAMVLEVCSTTPLESVGDV